MDTVTGDMPGDRVVGVKQNDGLEAKTCACC